MGLTCSLLGHAFDETDVDRDRSEQGSEVVTVERELEVCSRCGETRVISENKEVTTIVEPEEGDVSGFPPTADPDHDAAADLGDDTEDPASTTGGGMDAAAATPDADGDGEPDADAAAEPTPPDPAEEDAEILDDSDDEPERAPGEWPGDTTEGSTDTKVTGGLDLTTEPEEPPEPAAGGIPDGDFVCPECGFREPREASSLRAGDACPECQRGYLEAE